MIGRKIIFLLVVLSFLAGCGDGDDGKKDTFLRINNFSISREEIDAQLKFEQKLDSNFYISADTRTEFIQNLIQSQLLIQEAKRLKYDQQEQFRIAIQRYWESTLIRDLLSDRGNELRKSTLVEESEITSYYEENRDFLEGSFDELREEIRERLEEQKVKKKLSEWIDGLRGKADIEINDPELAAKIKSGQK